MKILYALQGTGNGHVSRSREIIPYLQKYGEVDVLISGTQIDFDPPCEVRYRKYGLSFGFDLKGGVGYFQSFKSARPLRFIKDVLSFPIQQYDLVINDFEPVVAWAARLKKIPCIAMGHQASFLSPKMPRPARRDAFGELVLGKLAPSTAAIGFGFKAYDDFIYTPVIHSGIRRATVSNAGHYTVYLPAYHERHFMGYLRQMRDIKWEVFSKHAKTTYKEENVLVRPISNQEYIDSLVSCAGLLTGGGFEAPAEALYLGKKLLMIPMKGQYEQHCNAAAAAELGVPLLKEIGKDFAQQLIIWIAEAQPISVYFEDQTAQLVEQLITKYSIAADKEKILVQEKKIEEMAGH